MSQAGENMVGLSCVSVPQSGQTFEGNVTSAVLRDLLPGETYEFRLRASNVAGLSGPSSTETYKPPPASKSMHGKYYNDIFSTALQLQNCCKAEVSLPGIYSIIVIH